MLLLPGATSQDKLVNLNVEVGRFSAWMVQIKLQTQKRLFFSTNYKRKPRLDVRVKLAHGACVWYFLHFHAVSDWTLEPCGDWQRSRIYLNLVSANKKLFVTLMKIIGIFLTDCNEKGAKTHQYIGFLMFLLGTFRPVTNCGTSFVRICDLW